MSYVAIFAVGWFVGAVTFMLKPRKCNEVGAAPAETAGAGHIAMNRDGTEGASSLAAISTQSSNFAQTPVGKLTVLLVIWKVVGDQAVHIVGGILLLLIAVPIWLWSFRRTCMTRRIKVAKETWKVVEYNSTGYGDLTPRIAHSLFAVAILGTFFVCVFSY